MPTLGFVLLLAVLNDGTSFDALTAAAEAILARVKFD